MKGSTLFLVLVLFSSVWGCQRDPELRDQQSEAAAVQLTQSEESNQTDRGSSSQDTTESKTAAAQPNESEESDLFDPGSPIQAVASGGAHSCALREDGEVFCWGSDDLGQLQVPPARFLKIVAGYRHNCGITDEGMVLCWGADDSGQSTPPEESFRDLSAWGDTTCGLDTADGAVKCWGDRENWDTPEPPGSFLTLSVGRMHCALDTDGQPHCWGSTALGGIYSANGTRFLDPQKEYLAVLTRGGLSYEERSIDYTECGLKKDGRLRCRGINQCDWNDISGTAPREVRLRSLTMGKAQSCGLEDDGTLHCWGRRWYFPDGRFRDVSAGKWHTCAVTLDGELACWGEDKDGQASPPRGLSLMPSLLNPPEEAFREVSVGGLHGCGISKEDGSVLCWGFNHRGQTTPPTGPFISVVVPSFTARAMMPDGSPESSSIWQPSYGCGLREDGRVECWGRYNDVVDGSFRQLSAGAGFVCALRSNGEIQCWNEWADQSPIKTPEGTFLQLDSGGFYSCAIRKEGTTLCWDHGPGIEMTPPQKHFESIAVGGFFGCGLDKSGQVECWTLNDLPMWYPWDSIVEELNLFTAPDGVFRQIDAAFFQACGVRAEDGEIQCWGMNVVQEDIPPGPFVKVHAGLVNCGIRESGEVVCWESGHRGIFDGC